MGNRGWALLTGATGFLGAYLLRDLLAVGPVAVLVRPSRSSPVEERVASLLPEVDVPASRLRVFAGDLGAPAIGLTIGDRRWLSRNCGSVIHAAACTHLHASRHGEPWRTNFDGTVRLLEWSARFGIETFHHISTAFVCGDRVGPIMEHDLEYGQQFHNEYERSKYAAEIQVRDRFGARATVYRPSVIVGHSQTGFTSTYQGFYRFFELADRLADRGGSGRRLSLRMPFRGTEPRNLVPVDWVSRAIATIVNQPANHGKTYHLVAHEPVLADEIKTVAERLLGIEGVTWNGPGPLADATALEGMFLEYARELWPYLAGDPVFDCRQTIAALPGLPAPRIDREFLERIIGFAITDDWGRRRVRSASRRRLDCAEFVESFFPDAVRQSSLATIPLTAVIGIDVRGPGGGQWTYCWRGGELEKVRRGLIDKAEAVYRMSTDTFAAIVQGRQSPQEAFFARHIEVAGNLEKALKLAVLFGKFVKECRYPALKLKEGPHAACHG